MIDFTVDQELSSQLDWIRHFVREEIEPLDVLYDYNANAPYDVRNPRLMEIVKRLQAMVRQKGLWAPHLDPELGGQGFGQVALCFINEELGRSAFAPRIFGAQAPDSGNSEILARFGTDEQKRRFLKPLLDGDIISCYSMTEPTGGSDPNEFKTMASRDRDGWRLEGQKWFSSNARYAAFLITMAISDAEAPKGKRHTMFLVPADTPGVEIVRNIGIWGEPEAESSHAWVSYNNVQLGPEAVLGQPGEGFAVAQSRLGGGRLHHAMRTVGACQAALDMACERVLSRRSRGKSLSDLGIVQDDIGRCWMELQQFRLFVLHTAWLYDQKRHAEAWTATAGVKAQMADTAHGIIWRCAHLHGSLGASNQMRFGQMISSAFRMGVVDGPTELHRSVVARSLLKSYRPVDGLFPTAHIPTMLDRARLKYPELAATLPLSHLQNGIAHLGA
jgi:acyl-CoA dehydrogenase